MLRNPKTNWYDLKNGAEGIILKTRPETVEGEANPSFLGHRQQHIIGEVSISVEFDAKAENEKAGLLAFQKETHYYYAALSKENEQPVVQLYKSDELIKSISLDNTVSEVEFKLKFEEDEYTFYYKTEGEWQQLGETQDGKFLSTQVAGGFVGVNLGLYTTSNGKSSDNEALFDWFHYSGNDEVYRD